MCEADARTQRSTRRQACHTCWFRSSSCFQALSSNSTWYVEATENTRWGMNNFHEHGRRRRHHLPHRSI